MKTITERSAQESDCRAIAELYRIASEGVSDYIWSTVAQPGEDLLTVGERRYQRRDTTFSFENCTVLATNTEVVGMLFAYPLFVDDNKIESDPVMQPYEFLEEDASYYISGLALYEPYRRRGLGKRLLQIAERQARECDLKKVSLIAFASNTPALNLYFQQGYKEKLRHKIFPHPLIHTEGDALLLVKQL